MVSNPAVSIFIRLAVSHAGWWTLSQARSPVAVAPAATEAPATHCMHMRQLWQTGQAWN